MNQWHKLSGWLKNHSYHDDFHFSLQSKLMVAFCFIFTVILAIANVVRIYGLPLTSFEGEYAQRQQEVLETLSLVADLKRNRLITWLEERTHDVYIFSNSPLLGESIATLQTTMHSLAQVGNPQDALWTALKAQPVYQSLQAHLSLLKSTYTVYASIQVVDAATGAILLSTEENQVGTSLSQEKFFIASLSPSHDGLIDLKQSASKNILDLFIASHVHTPEKPQGSGLGILLFFNIHPEQVALLLRSEESISPAGEVMLITQSMQLLSPVKHTMPDGSPVEQLSGNLATQLSALVINEKPGFLLEKDHREKAVLAVYRPIPVNAAMAWGLVVMSEEDKVFASLRQSMLYALLAGTVLSMFLGVLFSFILARSLSRPINLLCRTIQRIEVGDMDARAPVITNDEVGLLADMFNSMLDQLQRTQQRLEWLIEESAAELRTNNFSLVLTVEEMQDLNRDLEQEIVERKKVEAQLRKERLRQQIIFDSVPAFIWLKDKHNKVIWMNKPAAELSGVEPNHSEGYSLERLFPRGAEAAYQEDLEVINTSQAKLGIIKRLKTAAGEKMWIKTDKVPFIDEEGDIVGVVVLAVNITGRIVAEQALRESEERFRAIIDTAVDGIIMVNEKGFIQLVNPSLAKMCGYTIEELLGQHVHILLPPDDQGYDDDNYLHKYLRVGDDHLLGTGQEITGQRKEGSTFPIYLAVSELTLNHERMFAGIISDITKLKQAQEALQHSKDELEIQNRAYSRFVPREFLSFLGKESIVDVELGDQVQREMTVMFADIRSFTALSEKMTPSENFKFINSYLSRMEPVIQAHQGVIDKYIGDSIMALFPNSADDAVRAAIDMLYTLAKYNEDRVSTGYDPIDIGIGLHTGSLMLGTIGGKNRMDSTVISDAVNLASRVEAMTKMYGASILITEHTYNRLEDVDVYNIRVIDRVKVKGKSQPVIVFEILDGYLPTVREMKIVTLSMFTDAFIAYQRRFFEIAEARFQACLTFNPNDKAVKLYIERCQRLQKLGDLQNWDGITELTSKEGFFS